MKFGVREICDVVVKKKAEGRFGNLWLDAGAPVLYFDTLKTSSLEGAATTVYAQGGRGNPRLVAWEGDKTVTFTMEDALISPESFSILSGAGLIDASANQKIFVHTTERVEVKDDHINLSRVPAVSAEFYMMLLTADGAVDATKMPMKIPSSVLESATDPKVIDVQAAVRGWMGAYNDLQRHKDLKLKIADEEEAGWTNYPVPTVANGDVVYVDYYIEATSSVKQINIEASKFGGSYYLEASTLFRDQATGDDYPAEFVIPNCKVQSNFTFSLSPTGDPSTFTFTMDAFPDYTKFDKTKKVLAAIQIIEDAALIESKDE